jgi:nucleotide-binding universal stress UspA family protein
MAYKNLLVHIDDSKVCVVRLEAAMQLARAHEAHLTGIYAAIEPSLPGNVAAEVPAHLLDVLREQAAERVVAAKAAFVEPVEGAGLSSDFRAAHCTGSRVAELVALHARYADLVILGQPEPQNGGEVDAEMPEDVVLGAGRPALIVPYIGAGKEIGRRALIAWDGGREAARAVNDALPLLEKAESVAVLVINPSHGGHGPEPGADIALHLARHGIVVEAQHIEVRDISTGNALLSRLADEDIDLLVMGAYGHSRLRQMVLGGVTREVFQQMTVPVLMSH